VAQGKGPEFKPQYYTHTKKDSREKSMKLKSVYGVCVYVCGAVREREREREREIVQITSIRNETRYHYKLYR
jgi:hypothetical protein